MERKLLAPLSGVVIQLNIKEGDVVSEDDHALVMEAMKMKNPIFIPCNGTIKEIRVKEGDTVEEEDVLVIIDPE